jgi:TrmH family RNA methyltransferase
MITSTKNTRIIQAKKLTQRKHRRRQNKFLVEGLQLLSMALQAMPMPRGQSKIVPLEVFYSEELFSSAVAPALLAQLTAAGAEAIPVAAHVLDTLSQRDTSQGLTATFACRELACTPTELAAIATPAKQPTPPLLLILDRLQDPGNLGTLIRTADAVGAAAIILLEPCVDPFDPKTVRGTMGSIFTVPFLPTDNLEPLLASLREMGYRLIGADANRGQTVWRGHNLAGAVGLVLGNEARGLSPDLPAHLDGYVSLPIYGRAESLNVSIAGGALMYEWLRQNDR